MNNHFRIEYHIWSRICFVCGNRNPVIFALLNYHRNFNKSNTTGTTTWSGTTYPSYHLVPLLDQELLTHRITWYHYLIRNYLPVVSPGTTTWSGTTYPSYHLVPLLDQELLTHRITWYRYLIRNCLPIVSPGTTTWSGTAYPSYHLVPLLDQELLTHRITRYHYLIRNYLPIVHPCFTVGLFLLNLSLVFSVVFCQAVCLFIPCLWPLCRRFFFELLLLISLLVSSKFSMWSRVRSSVRQLA